MKISLNWLKQCIDLPKNVTPEKVAQDLTMATVEVESVTNQAEQFDKIVIGKVIELKKHPNADKLQIAMTDIGDSKKQKIKKTKNQNVNNLVQIVCGGVNLKQGMLVAVALPGAKVKWHGEGDLVELEEAKIRGEKSFGMICSSNEIGLENMFPISAEEIIDLTPLVGDKVSQPVAVKGAGYETSAQQRSIKPGMPLSQALDLGDVVFEIDNQSMTHRPDLWSHYGIARELAAIYKIKIKELKVFCHPELGSGSRQKTTGSRNKFGMTIEIQNKNLCSRYIGCLIENIKVEKSPDWLIKKLEAVGIRAINNIVDITNYVMLDVGEPTHAFDKAKLDQQILIRSAKPGEKIKTLDGEMYKLDEDMLVIADAKKPIGIAGIMGGANSEVTNKTKSIILEAATFDAISVRKTSQKLGLRTEASMRFEKSLDYNLAQTGMQRALQLIKEICPQAEISSLIDVDYNKASKTVVKVKHEFLEKRIGQKLNNKEVLGILERLGFKVKEKNGTYAVQVPSWRATGDVSIPEDIVEEVARIYGYDNLPEKKEMMELTQAKYQPEYELENKIKSYLSLGCGMHEVFNYAWPEEKILKKLGLKNDMLEIANPPSEENKYLQNSLIPNLIKNVQDNLRYFPEIKIFELAHMFKSAEDQPKMLAGVVVGKGDVFLKIKGILQGMNLEFGISNLEFGFLDKNKSLDVIIGKEKIGWVGEYRDSPCEMPRSGNSTKGRIISQGKIKNKNVALFEIDFDKLCRNEALPRSDKKHKPLTQYPSIERDIAVEIDWDIKWEDVKKALEKIDDLVYNIEFVSEYDLGNKKSLAFRVTYQADRTLKDKEVEIVEKEIIKVLEKKFNAKLRG